MYLSPSPCEAPRLPLIPYICPPLAELEEEEEARLDLSQMFLYCGMKERYAENMGQAFSCNAIFYLSWKGAYRYSFKSIWDMKHDI